MTLRTLHRRKSFKTVRFIQTVGGDGIDCRMADMHSEGARLVFPGLCTNTSDEVEIMILPELVPVRAKRVWQTEREMGIRFKKPLEYLKKADAPAAARTTSS